MVNFVQNKLLTRQGTSKNTSKPEWMVKALSTDATTTLQPGGTVDDMIPLLFKKQLVGFPF